MQKTFAIAPTGLQSRANNPVINNNAGQNYNPAAFAAAQPAPMIAGCGSFKPYIPKQIVTFYAVPGAALTTYLPSNDGFAEINSGAPTNTALEVTGAQMKILQLPSANEGLVGNGEFTYDNATNAIVGKVAFTHASAFAKRMATIPHLCSRIEISTGDSTAVVQQINVTYGNFDGNTPKIITLVQEQQASSSSTIYSSNEPFWVTGNCQINIALPSAGTFYFKFYFTATGDNSTDMI